MADKQPVMVDPLDWARAYLSGEEFKRLTRSLDEPLALSIRINTLKWSAGEAVEQLTRRYGWAFTPIPFCSSGFWVSDYELSPSITIEHRMGYFYIQEAASMLPPELFDINTLLGAKHASRLQDNPEFPLILDMAASPGGKTTHLAALAGGRGLIVANDGSRSRIPALQVVLRGWGAINQCVTCLPGESFGALHPDTFDAVLLDAPCSMQGLRAAESHASRHIGQNEIESLAARQLRLLESALRCAKPGGQVVYSTCTLAPQEDELVLAAVLEKFGGAIQVEDMSSKLPAPAPALSVVDCKSLPDGVKHALRLWPHTYGTAGFFAARLTKTGEIPMEDASAWRTAPDRAQFAPAPKTLSKAIHASLAENWGFELAALMERQQLTLAFNKDRIFLIHESLINNPLELPFLSTGMELGKRAGDDLVISHEMASRFGDQFKHGVLMLDNAYLPAWLRGEDLRGFRHDQLESGRFYTVRDESGRNLGRGKLLADRLKNMLPTRLF
jgi:16S rRNA (cytosine1407-C5)-methyltransferase